MLELMKDIGEIEFFIIPIVLPLFLVLKRYFVICFLPFNSRLRISSGNQAFLKAIIQ
jgi:hypothetical protein